ncbi:hypothetical protein FSARC_5499 [Fusarium sarcochroum]|uniref:FAD-binding FR-type domain-containing protein n=1 Tax=Fusarium sarcochroum TaxID=1208366 RepID=A0A8H4XAC7_9HYPO|nr:hypothetical protein FSARC_5499 [Fusarium sarcochroum]
MKEVLPGWCLGTLEEILKRAEDWQFCLLIIDAHKEWYRRAPHGLLTDIYYRNNPHFRDEALRISGTEVHEEVKEYGLRLTAENEPIECRLKRGQFSLTFLVPLIEDEAESNNDRTVGVGRVQIMLESCPWYNLNPDAIKLQAIWPDGISDMEKRTSSGGYLSMEGTGRAIGHLVDFSVARNWIHQCEETHGDKCHKPDWLSDSDNEWPKRGRVIDMKESRIVYLHPSMRYVALSYVWGSDEKARKLRLKRQLTRENLPRLQTHDGLDEMSLPQTVKDAMDDDQEDLSHQTARMDPIYSKAFFTIVAACGDDSDSGRLAGLPSHPRDLFQRQVKVSPSGLHITPCAALSDDDTLQCSVWNNRGWTFQERLLSRRALIFTASQVYWSCEDATWDEESLLDLPETTAYASRSEFGCYDVWESWYAKLSRQVLRVYITQLCQRDFTFPGDALPAFTGIIRRYENLNKEKLLWGLRTIRFDQDLTWDFGSWRRKEMYTFAPEGSAVRSVPYPSWSWLGCTGSISTNGWGRDLDERTKRGQSKSVLAFYSLMSDGSVSLIEDNVESSPPSLSESVTSTWKGETTISEPIVVPGVSIALGLGFLKIAETEEKPQKCTASYDTRRLVFWTSHTEVPIWVEGYRKIGIQTQDTFLEIDTTFSGGFSSTSLLSPKVGSVDGNEGDTDIGRSRQKGHLIVVSRRFEIAHSEDTGMLNIMMVEEKVPGSGVWSRLGLAVIDEKDWVRLDLDWRMLAFGIAFRHVEAKGADISLDMPTSSSPTPHELSQATRLEDNHEAMAYYAAALAAAIALFSIVRFSKSPKTRALIFSCFATTFSALAWILRYFVRTPKRVLLRACPGVGSVGRLSVVSAYFALNVIFLFVHADFESKPMRFVIGARAGWAIIAIGLAAGLWVADHFLRLIRTLPSFNNAVTVFPLANGGTRVTLKKALWTAPPGRHAYLWIPCIRAFETHPYTITQKKPMQFVVAARNGFTRDLYNYAVKNPGTSLKPCVQGPYGTVPEAAAYDKVVLIAGGSGASFTTGVAMDLIHRFKKPDITFIWTVKKLDSLDWFTRKIRRLNQQSNVNVRLFVTSETLKTPESDQHTLIDENRTGEDIYPIGTEFDIEAFPRKERPSAELLGLPITYGRPNVPGLIRDEVRKAAATERVLVMACGPAGLMREVNNTAASCIKVRGPDVDIHCEKFGCLASLIFHRVENDEGSSKPAKV